MALVDNAWYVNFGDGSTTGYYAVTQWATGTVTAAGALRRQLAAAAVGNERVFVCVVAGTTHATTEPTWVLTRGATTTDNTVTWQECTGIAALNGDAINTPSWTISATPPGGVKNTAVTKGQVIKRDSGASYQICTTAGTAGNGAEPAFSNTAGTTTSDNTVTWTSLGVVGNFATAYGAPHARWGNALATTWAQAGNKVLVADNSVETQATGGGLNIVGAGTATLPIITWCADKAVANPGGGDLKTTASITNTQVADCFIHGYHYIYGITFQHNAGGGNLFIGRQTASSMTLDNCLLKLGTSSPASGQITFGTVAGSSPSQIILINTPLSFNDTGQSIVLQETRVLWKNTASALVGAAVPTTLFSASGVNTAFSARLTCTGVDLSAAGSGKTLVGSILASWDILFCRCKLGSSVTVAAAPDGPNYGNTNVIQCDSGATNYRQERYWSAGTQTAETTIVRTGGATDGTTVLAYKLLMTANATWLSPFESFPISIWNDSTSAITTLTIYGTTTGGGVPNNDDIWVEVEYLGSSATPHASFITSTKANGLAASVTTNNSSDASTWGGGGAGNGFKIVVPSFTPGMAGPINLTIKAAKVSATYYIDPRPSISGVTVSKSEILAPGVYANERSAGGSAGMRYRNLMRGNLG